MLKCFKMKYALTKATYFYLISAIGIFIFSTIAKLTARYSAIELSQHDVFLSFLTVKQLLLVAIGVEIATVVLIVLKFRRYPRDGTLVAVWLALLFLAYRLAFAFAPENIQGRICKCFGGAGGILGKNSDKVAWILLFYLLGIGIALLMLWNVINRLEKKNKKAVSAPIQNVAF